MTVGNLTKIVICHEQCDIKIAKSNRTLMKFFEKKARASTFSSQTKHITHNDLVDGSLKTKSIYFGLNYTSSKDF